MNKNIRNIIIYLLAGLAVLLVLAYKFLPVDNNAVDDYQINISNFEECATAGNPVMESYPRQCRANGQTFVEEIKKSYDNLIRVFSPVENQEITSPLTIEGEAVGNWFFEASFPVFLVNWDGLIIAQGIAAAQSDWMTTDFVPFKVVLEFEADTQVSNRGALILKKDNPSGLPQYDDALEMPVIFK